MKIRGAFGNILRISYIEGGSHHELFYGLSQSAHHKEWVL